MTYLTSSFRLCRQNSATISADWIDAALGTVTAALVILLWLSALYGGSDLGGFVYLTPIAIVLAGAAVGGTASILRGSDRALSRLLFLAMVVLLINFRQREPGEAGLDAQNGIKVAFWVVMIGTALPNRHVLLALLKNSFTCRWAFGFCAFAAISVLWSAEPGVTAASGVGLFAALTFSFVLAMRVSPVDVHRVLFWAMAILIVAAFASYVVAPSIALLPPSEGESEYRLQGLAGHPNLLGQQAAVLLLMTIAMWEERAVRRLWLVPIGCAAITALIFSESRTSLVGVVVAFVVVRLRQMRLLKSVSVAALAVAAAVVFLAAVDMMPDIAKHLSGLTRSGSASELTTFTGRTELWEISWERFLQKPWLGWGFNANERLMLDSVGPNFAGNAVNSHNMYLQALVTMGVVGTVMVMAFVAGMARNTIFQPNAMRDRIFVYLMVLGIAEAEFLTLPVVTIYLAFWAVADAVVEQHGRTGRASNSQA